ncbi:MAG: glycosyltransferase family 2 protein [Burkholderiales bacterium]|nr:glycosyltransferase family 2 protein [Burkholderiales bacterium]
MNESRFPPPLVTVLTPVFNGAEHLRECIESVQSQSYQHWNYWIVDNCSSDATVEIARSYVALDPRIHVALNTRHVSMPQNFNRAFALVPPESDYFKVVCADDWILPQCLERMVELANRHPSIGILCCHQQSGNRLRWAELPSDQAFLPGRLACRKVLLDGANILGAPTASMYRSDLLRLGKPFFPHDGPHSDTSACFEFLDRCDFGVVHEALAVERVHAEQITSKIERFAAGNLAYLEAVVHYGPRYLTPSELETRLLEVFASYYRDLGGALLKLREPAFWRFHRDGLRAMGRDLEWSRVIRAAFAEAAVESKHPMLAARKFASAVRDRLGQ